MAYIILGLLRLKIKGKMSIYTTKPFGCPNGPNITEPNFILLKWFSFSFYLVVQFKIYGNLVCVYSSVLIIENQM